LFGAAFAGWFGTVLSAVSCAGELAMSGIVPWQAVFPAMAGVHMLIGLGEGLATALIVVAVMRHRPTLIRGLAPEAAPGRVGVVIYGALIAVGLAVFVAPHASSLPDGLEAVAQKLGFEDRAASSAIPSPIPDYHVPLIDSPASATAVAGAIGTVIALFGAYGLACVLTPRLAGRTLSSSGATGRGGLIVNSGSHASVQERPAGSENQDASAGA
jgi:cobalt/nickel transport system permease protein